jgi:DNA-binding SARP family transcriptional activator
MAEPTEQQIIERAYELWEKAGRTEGRAEEFYRQAEQELRTDPGFSPEPDIL